MEYISREAALKELCSRCADAAVCTRGDNDCPIKRGLNSIPAADVVERPRWIPVGERLPEPGTKVMVAFNDGEVWCLWQNWTNQDEHDEPLFYFTDPFTGYGHTVTHWQIMPVPPKEEEA